MISYLSEFTIIKEFTNENYHSRVSSTDSKDFQFQYEIQNAVKSHFEKSAFFSTQEHRILKKYATTQNITSEAIAKAFKVEKVSVNTYNKRILKKAKELFNYQFVNAKEVGLWLRETGLL